MTLAQLPRFKEYQADGVTTAFPIPFQFFDTTDVEVYTLAAGVETIVSTGRTITGGNGSTGTCTFTTAPAIAAGVVGVRARTPIKQSEEYPNGGTFPSETAERGYDRAAAIDQEQQDQIDGNAARTPMVPKGVTAPQIIDLSGIDNALMLYKDGKLQVLDKARFAGKFIGGDAEGNPVPLSGTGADGALRVDLAGDDGDTLVGNAYDGSVGVGLRNRLSVLATVLAGASRIIPPDAWAIDTTRYSTTNNRGGARYRRRVGPAPVLSGGFRTADRYLPDGTIDEDDGGYWELAEEFINPLAFGAVDDVTVDSTDAVQAAIDYAHDKKLSVILTGSHLVGDLTLYDGITIRGAGVLAYDFDGYTTDIPATPELRLKTGGTRLFNLTGRIDITIEGLHLSSQANIDARNDPDTPTNTWAGIAITGGGRRVVLNRLFVRGFAYGLGYNAGADDKYPHATRGVDCIISNCQTGVYSPVDSYFSNLQVNACQANIVMQTGSNNVVFLGGRCEWSLQDGANLFGAYNVRFIGMSFDRCGYRALRTGGNSGLIAVIGCPMTRSGAQASGANDNDCHMQLDGVFGLTVQGSHFGTGGNDDGSGYVSPKYGVRMNAPGNNDIAFSGCSTRGGCTGSTFFSSSVTQDRPADWSVWNCPGVPNEIFTSRASFTGSITATTLTVTAGTPPAVGDLIGGASVSANTSVSADNGDGTFTITPSQTRTSRAMQALYGPSFVNQTWRKSHMPTTTIAAGATVNFFLAMDAVSQYGQPAVGTIMVRARSDAGLNGAGRVPVLLSNEGTVSLDYGTPYALVSRGGNGPTVATSGSSGMVLGVPVATANGRAKIPITNNLANSATVDVLMAA